AQLADHFLQIEADSDVDVLSAVRALVAGVTIGSESVGGLSRTQLEQLANALRHARYGAVFYGSELANSSVPHLAVESLLRLVTDLNTTTRCVARAMRPTG